MTQGDRIEAHGHVTLVCGSNRLKVSFPKDGHISATAALEQVKMALEALRSVQGGTNG